MCIESFFGIPLKKAVYGLGLFKLVLTLIFAIISIVEQSQEVCNDDETKKPIQCVGPMVQKVFLFFFFQKSFKLYYNAQHFPPGFLRPSFPAGLRPLPYLWGKEGKSLSPHLLVLHCLRQLHPVSLCFLRVRLVRSWCKLCQLFCIVVFVLTYLYISRGKSHVSTGLYKT